MDQDQQQAKAKNRAPSNQEDSFKQGGATREANSTSNPPPESPPMPPQIDSVFVPVPPSPPSTASPTHEFSFTISIDNMNRVPLHPRPPCTAAAALDLSPADDIFFHGHLLPLHLLSHLPVSPRSSTNSLESFTLPINDSQQEHQKQYKVSKSECISISSTNRNNIERPKSKSFSLLKLPKWRKECEIGDSGEKEKQGRKQRFDVSRVLKRYVTMMRPLLIFARRRKDAAVRVRRQTYSFSGIVSPRDRERQGRRGLFSAPASMRASPANSGLILAKATSNPPSTASDSTMEELQAAIQAAIAHCKNSIAVEDNKLQV